jgi:menaquinone-specific isochorismate synthase
MAGSDEEACGDETNETGETSDRGQAFWPPAGLFCVPGLPAPLVLMPPDRADREPEIRIAYGEAARLNPAGPDRMQRLAQDGQALLSTLVELADAPPAEPAPACLYGVLQFQAAGTAQPVGDPWRDLPEAHFVLPRWLLRLRGRRGVLELVASARELLEPRAIFDELAAIERALQGASGRPRTPQASQAAQSTECPARIRSLADPQRFRLLVAQALQHIAKGDLAKVVLARMQAVQRSDGHGFDAATALASLGAAYPACLRFALPVADATFLGASPELLVERQGHSVRCDALAGSRPWHPSGESAAAAAEALLRDEKEAREHAYVVDAIRERLARHGSVEADATPRTRVLRNVVHLWTPVAATLDPPPHILQLLAELHPTPAVCGVPQQAALDFIAQREALPRGYYAAPIGWFDSQGNGAFYVAIRSALLRGDRAWLFAGAGIVAGSDPDRELRETAAKLRPMLTALGIDDTPQRISA